VILRETRFNDAFYYFRYMKEVGNWTVIRDSLSLSDVGFCSGGNMIHSLRIRMDNGCHNGSGYF